MTRIKCFTIAAICSGAILAIPAGAQALPLWEVGPAWHVLPAGTYESLKTSGEMVMYEVGKLSGAKCTIVDAEQIDNPVSGGPGEDDMETFRAECHGAAIYPCSGAEKFVASGIDWPSKLVGAEDEFPVSPTELECLSSGSKQAYGGDLHPTLGANKLTFGGAASGVLKAGAHEIDFKGKDKLKALLWAKVR